MRVCQQVFANYVIIYAVLCNHQKLLIKFEHMHLSKYDFTACQKLLRQNGFATSFKWD